jgi:hypothetical protein
MFPCSGPAGPEHSKADGFDAFLRVEKHFDPGNKPEITNLSIIVKARPQPVRLPFPLLVRPDAPLWEFPGPARQAQTAIPIRPARKLKVNFQGGHHWLKPIQFAR